jgi:predicted DNA-binding transcriptional regulator AlpA
MSGEGCFFFSPLHPTEGLMSEKRLMRPQEYAEHMNYKLGTIYNKINRNEFLPGLVKIPNQGKRPTVRFDRKALDAWLDSQVGKEG